MEKQERLNKLFAKLQEPVEKGFKGSTDDYRKSFLQEIETTLSSHEELSSYNLPINSQTKCHGETFLYRSTQYNLPLLTQKLVTSAEKINLAKTFWEASFRGHTKIVENLLVAHPMVTWQDENHLGTALHNAAYRGHKEVVEKIIEYCRTHNKKDTIKIPDSYGQTPLDYAQEKKNVEIIALIKNALND
jgi:ankyrin repeat protein